MRKRDAVMTLGFGAALILVATNLNAQAKAPQPWVSGQNLAQGEAQKIEWRRQHVYDEIQSPSMRAIETQAANRG